MATEIPGSEIPGSEPPGGGFPGGQSSGMVGRVKRLLMTPKEEWARIDPEPSTAKGVFMAWAVPLAAIPAICGFVGRAVFGWSFLGVHYRPPLVGSLVTAVIGYAVALVGVWILALVIEALAPTFGSTKSRDQAMKAAAYSYTASWVAGVLMLLPSLTMIAALLGLYSFYLLWIGLPMLMKTPADKAAGYVAASVVAAIVIYIVIGAVVGAATSSMLTSGASFASPSGGSISIGGTTIDTDKINAAAAKMEAASAQMQADARNGTSHAIPVADLQAMLPASIGGFARGDVETQSGSAAGIGGSQAKAHYTQGDQGFDLSVSDMGAMGAIATLGGAVNAQSSKTTATGYEKTEMVSGSMVSERWDNQSHSGSYSTVVASRFAVAAEGSAPAIDVLKGAVGAIDAGRLAGLAK